jgi:hypothetical protein
LGRDQVRSLLAWSIVTMYAAHWPYWYVGIMGWHYVYETVALWMLLWADFAAKFWSSAVKGRQWSRCVWLLGLPWLAWSGMYLSLGEEWPARWERGVGSMQFPRQQQAAFREWVAENVGDQPALVLIDPTGSNPHLDYVVNHAGLTDAIWYGRYRPGQTDLREIIAAFPERQVYLVEPDARRLTLAKDLVPQ